MEYIKITKVDDVVLHRKGIATRGTLHLTSHHLIFSSESLTREFWVSYPTVGSVFKNQGSTLISKIKGDSKNKDNIEFDSDDKNLYKWYQGRDLWNFINIKLVGKDYTIFSLDFVSESDAKDVFESLSKLIVLDDVSNLYAYIYKPCKAEIGFNSWDLYDPVREFQRQGLVLNSEECPWRISNINEKYEFSPTYPKSLVVPRAISDTLLRHAGKYRSKSRVPALTYYYKRNKCSITRSAQPLPGITKNRSIQDEKLVSKGFNCSSSNVSNIEKSLSPPPLISSIHSKDIIVDARPTANAIAQTALGGGSENMDNYNFNDTCQRMFLGIDNIHAMSDTINYVVDNYLVDGDLNYPIDKGLLNSGKGSNWLKYTKLLLSSTETLLKSIIFNHSNLLIHCSDGWDRTTQISSLVQLCLDPYFRTFEGFMVLIEKDWLSFGYKFLERSGHLSSDVIFHDNTTGFNNLSLFSNNNNSQSNNLESSSALFDSDDTRLPRIDGLKHFSSNNIVNKVSGHFRRKKGHRSLKFSSPVFQQFLDSVYQLIIQNPNEFEFNERFLRRLVYHLYSCQYGSFLYNSEKDRLDNDVYTKTRSVWDYFRCRRNEFLNKSYIQPGYLSNQNSDEFKATADSEVEDWILPDLNNIQWWWQLYGRKNEEMNGTVSLGASEINEKLQKLGISLEGKYKGNTFLPFGVDIFGTR